MSHSTSIRLGRPEDADAVTAIWHQMAEAHRAYDPAHWDWAANAPARWHDWYLQLIADPAMFCLVAVDGAGHIAGYLVGKAGEHPPVFSHRARGDVFDIAVREDCRRAGIGSALLRAAMEEFRRLGCREMLLSVASPNAEAIAFYTRHGMREVTRSMCLPLAPEDCHE